MNVNRQMIIAIEGKPKTIFSNISGIYYFLNFEDYPCSADSIRIRDIEFISRKGNNS